MWFGVLQTLEWAGLLDEEFTRLGPEEILVRAWRGRATMEANEAAGVCSGPCDHSRCRQIRDLRARLEELA